MINFTCSVCTAHTRATQENYEKWDKRCADCFEQDRATLYPFKNYTQVYNAIMLGKKVKYKIAKGFYIEGDLVSIGIGQAKKQLPAITNDTGQIIEFGRQAVMASIKRTYPQLWMAVQDG